MTSEPSRAAHRQPQPLTAERLRELIARYLHDQEDVVTCRPTRTVYVDRLALSVEDRAGQLWRVHVLIEPRP